MRLDGAAKFGRDGTGFAGRDLSEAIGGLAWETNREGHRLGVRLSHYSFELLGSYLQAYFEDGASFADAIRPVPWRLRARIAVESMIGRPLRGLALRLPLASESTYTLPPGLLRFAH